MANFKIEPIVREILKHNPDTRSDDFLLYRAVCKRICPMVFGVLSFDRALSYHKEIGLPSWETVSRCRRKIQEHHPELRDERTARIRDEEELAYVEYARS